MQLRNVTRRIQWFSKKCVRALRTASAWIQKTAKKCFEKCIRALRTASAWIQEKIQRISRPTLKGKSMIWVGALLVCAIVLITQWLIILFEQELLKEKDVRARSLVSNVITLNSETIKLSESFPLDIVVTRVTNNEPDILYIVITDKSGKDHISTIEEKRETINGFLNRLGTPEGELTSSELIFGEIPILDYSGAVVINGDRVGSYRFGISKESQRKTLLQMQFKVYGAALIITFMFIFLTYMIVRHAFKRMDELDSLAHKLEQGEFGETVEIHHSDELAELAQTFNSLSLRIKKLLEEQAENMVIGREMELASEIQQSLMPQDKDLRDIPGLKVCVHCSPASQMGGDVLAVFPLDATKYGFVLGDVSGHGLQASLIMAPTVMMLQLATLIRPKNPKEALIMVNEVLTKRLGKSHYVTLIYVVIDTSTGEAQLLSAGHCAGRTEPLLVSNGKAEKIDSRGIALAGRKKPEPFKKNLHVTKLSLNKKGDHLVLFTDGIPEALNPNREEFGVDRVIEVVTSQEFSNADDPAKYLHEHVEIFSASEPQSDDVSVLTITRKD